MNKSKYEELFHELNDGGESTLLNFIYVSLISSDTITNLETCNQSIEELRNMRVTVASCDINKNVKETWMNRIENGLEICEKEKQYFDDDTN